MGSHVFLISVAAANPGYIRGKVDSGVFAAVVAAATIQNDDQHDNDSNCQNPDENVPPFS